MSWIVRVVGILLFAVALPFLTDRVPAIKMLYHNADSRLPQYSEWPEYKVLWADQLRNCEDAVLNDDVGIAYFSCDPGRDRWSPVLGTLIDPTWKTGDIWYYDYSKHSYAEPGMPSKMTLSGLSDTQRATFHPLGISLDREHSMLYVVNLTPNHTIEIFKLSSDGTAAQHIRTLIHPLIVSPNQVAPLSDHEILFTNDHKYTQAENSILGHIETYLALPLGSIVYLNLATNEARVIGKVPFANGIVPLNATHLAVASASLPGIFIYAFDRDTKTLILEQKLRPHFFADNLSVDANGKLLIAGHPHPVSVNNIGRIGRRYNIDNDAAILDLLPGIGRPRTTSWIAEWDGNAEGHLRSLYIGHDFGSSSSASRDVKRGIGMAGALYDNGILVWRE